MKSAWGFMLVIGSLIVFFLPQSVAQSKQPELTGNLRVDIASESGRVENLAVVIGDGGTGPYKSILAGDSSLPTHAIYRPQDLGTFGPKNLLPIVAFGNGGCRNSSGEFRNFLSEIASHGYLVLAIGPAGDALVGGSEGRLEQTNATQLLDAVEWATKENGRPGSEYYQKIDVSDVAVMGQSCGTRQAAQVSNDPRVKTVVFLNGGGSFARSAQSSNEPASVSAGTKQTPGAYGTAGTTRTQMFAGLENMARRYAPYAPSSVSEMRSIEENSPRAVYHAPVAFINGGPSDIAFQGAKDAFTSVDNVPALFAYQDVGHYPATFRQAHGGAFAKAAIAWLDWNIKGMQSAGKAFVGSDCTLCKDPAWTIQFKTPTR